MSSTLPKTDTIAAHFPLNGVNPFLLHHFVTSKNILALDYGFLHFVVVVVVFRVSPMAYGSSQARGRIGARAALPACTTATAMPDPSRICNLRHSSWQRWISDPLS